MLTIRDEQLTVFERRYARDFEDRMVRHIAGEYPDHYGWLGEDGVRRLIAHAKGIASAHKVAGKGPLGVLVELLLEFGLSFERSPDQGDALDLLFHEKLPASLKMTLVQEVLTELTGGRTLAPDSGATES